MPIDPTPDQNPNFRLEILIRQYILRKLPNLVEFQTLLSQDPDLQAIFLSKGGFIQHLLRVETDFRFYPYLNSLYFYFFLFDFTRFQEENKNQLESVTTNINVGFNSVQTFQQETRVSLTSLTTNIEQITNNLQVSINYLRNNISVQINNLETLDRNALAGISESLGRLLNRVQRLEGGITRLMNQLETVSERLLTAEEENTRSIIGRLDTLPDIITRKLEEKVDSFAEIVANKVSLKIVGESYYKWDATNTYYPTLVCLFKEKHSLQNPRKSQIKIRLIEKSEEVTESVIERVKERIVSLPVKSYIYGSVRGNYVSSDKRFKTTIYGSTKQQIIHILESLHSIIEQPFELENLTITEGVRRNNINKRITPLSTNPLSPANYQDRFEVQLFRVCLLVNGLSRPEVLWNEPV